MLLLITIILGLILARRVYFHMKRHILTFETGKWNLKFSKQNGFILVSFYKWMYVNDLEEMSRRLDIIIKRERENPGMYKKAIDLCHKKLKDKK